MLILDIGRNCIFRDDDMDIPRRILLKASMLRFLKPVKSLSLQCLSTGVIIQWDGLLNADNSIPMFWRPKSLSLALSRKFRSSQLGRHDVTVLSQLAIRSLKFFPWRVATPISSNSNI